ncbi:MAG: Arc family DNA-binding protein [Verrucomicrobiales bacterium]
MRVPDLLVRNIPEDVYECLKSAAVTHGRSLNKEVIVTLEEHLIRAPEAKKRPKMPNPIPPKGPSLRKERRGFRS